MIENSIVMQPFSPADHALIEELLKKAWFKFLRLYLLLFGILVYLYFRITSTNSVGHYAFKRNDKGLFLTVFPYFSFFFGAIFLIFGIKDFRRLILPLLTEKKMGKKVCEKFTARKYQDILYNKCLLFYPRKENLYIEISKADFDSIANGDELYLETGSINGEVLALKSGDRAFINPEEFSFSDR